MDLALKSVEENQSTTNFELDMAKKRVSAKKKAATKTTKKKVAKKSAVKKKAAAKKNPAKNPDNRANSESRRFEFSSGTSNKFWEIHQNGNQYTVRYGRIGTKGQTPSTKQLDTLEAASRAVTKLVSEKLKKGYLEVAAGCSKVAESRQTSRPRKAPVSKSTTGPDDDAIKTIKQLLRKKDSKSVACAVKQIENSALTGEELDDIFSDRMINLLVNTWDMGVWKSTGPLLAQYPSLVATFGETAADRLGKASWRVRKDFLDKAIDDVTPELVPVVQQLLRGSDTAISIFTNKPSVHAVNCAVETKGSLSLYCKSLCQESVDLLSRYKGDALEISGLNEISESLAETLATYEGSSLTIESKQKELKEKAAQHLGTFQGEWLNINCQMLSPQAADYLCQYTGCLGLEELREVPTEDLARKLCDSNNSFAKIRSLADPIMKVLSEGEETLQLEQLQSLSDVAAEFLSGHKTTSSINGFSLHLDKIKKLSDSAVESLSKYDPENAGIYLAGLKTLSDTALEKFVATDMTIEYGDNSYYNRLGRLALPVSFKTRVARLRKQLKEKSRSESSRTSVLTKDRLAKLKKLVKTKTAGNISLATNLLRSLEALPSDWEVIFSSSAISVLVNTWDISVWNALAEGIESNQEMFAEFNKLIATRFGDISSKEMKLAEVECPYYLENYEKQEVFLAARINHVEEALVPVFRELIGERRLDLSNLQSITESASSVLSKCDEVNLSGLKTLSDIAASNLSSVGNLDLSGLTTCSDETAQHLSKTKGEWLRLSGLKNLTPSAARSLSRYKGELDLSGLKPLTAEVAEALSKYKGSITVSSLNIVWGAK